MTGRLALRSRVRALLVLLPLGLAAAQARPPALQDVDSRGFGPWIAQAQESPSTEDLDWAAHLLLFCAEPERWLDSARSGAWPTSGRAGVRERVVSLNERAARLCQTVTPDQLTALPQLAARLAARGHPIDGLRALGMSPSERQAARERAQGRSAQHQRALWTYSEEAYWLLWTLRLCTPAAFQADPEWQALWERLEVMRQAQQLPEAAAPDADPRRPREMRRTVVGLRPSFDALDTMKERLLQHCPAARDASR